MTAQWHFPADPTSEIKGIANKEMSGKESPLSTMVREVCQNSKDAKDAESPGPVRVEFHTYSMDSSEIPGVCELRTAFERCRAMGQEYENNKRTEKAYEDMLKVLDEPKVRMLRISDFNTTGLEGSERDSYTAPWNSFIFGSGVSDKSGDSGGSRGRGKDSICAMSLIKTVFYSTLDKEGNEASVGCSYQITHKGCDGEKLSDIGRYHEDGEDFSRGQLSLDPSFERVEPGTDIYVIALDGSWEDDSAITLTVIRDYFVGIMDGDLEVSVNDVLINKGSVKRILEDMDRSADESGTIDFVSELIECYESGPVGGDARFQVYLKESEINSIASVRSGMTIARDFYKTRGRSVLGAVVIRSIGASETLILAETASHDSWDYTRAPVESRPVVKKLIDSIKETIRSCIKDLQEDEGADRLDAAGLEAYLPMSGDSFTQEVAEKEHLFDPVSRTTFKRRPVVDRQPSDVGQNVVRSTSPSEERPDGFEDNGPVNASDERSKSDPLPRTNIRPGTDESFKRVFKEKSVTLGNLRTFCTDSSRNMYRVVFDVASSCSVYLEARVFSLYDNKAEPKAEPVPVAEAYDSCGNSLPVCKSRIGPIDAKGGIRSFLDIAIDYPVTGRITVVAIENQEVGSQ